MLPPALRSSHIWRKNMKTFQLLIYAVVLMLVSNNPLHAAARKWEVDKAHSGFHFSVDHIFSTINGFFNDFEVEMRFDPSDLKASQMVFTIKVASIDTNIEKRDKHLQSPDFFDAATYPTMTFTSKKITKTGENSYDVAGEFEVKGVKYDLVLPLTLAGIKQHPMDNKKDILGFNGSIILDRLLYKVGTGKFADLGIIGKDVDARITLELLSDN